jgi:hypothetical protein
MADKIKVDLVDSYSDEEKTVIHSDKGDYILPKGKIGIYKTDEETNKLVKVDEDESRMLMDGWIENVTKEHDPIATSLDNDWVRSYGDPGTLISAINRSR